MPDTIELTLSSKGFLLWLSPADRHYSPSFPNNIQSSVIPIIMPIEMSVSCAMLKNFLVRRFQRTSERGGKMSGWVLRVSEYVKPKGPSSKPMDQAKVDVFQALMEDGSAEAVRAMAHAMSREPEAFDSYVEIMGSLGEEGIVHLRDMLADEREEDRHDAAIALAFVDDPKATSVLLEAMDSEDDTVREQTMNALCLKDDARIEDVALRHVKDENYMVRRDAIAYLCRYEKYRGVLEEALRDPCDLVRVKAAVTLALNEDHDAYGLLETLAGSSVDINVQFDALTALSYMKDGEALAKLYCFAESEEPSYERTLARAKLRGLGLTYKGIVKG